MKYIRLCVSIIDYARTKESSSMQSSFTASKDKDVAFWDSAAKVWHALRLASEPEVRTLVKDVECVPNDLILDAGCGSGRRSIALALKGFHIYGIDFSKKMIIAARKAARRHGLQQNAVQFQVADLQNIPFATATFDGILCLMVLDFVRSPGIALSEMWRVLKPGHYMVLVMLGAYSPVKRGRWRRFLPTKPMTQPGNAILPWETEALLEALGWQIVTQRPCFGGTLAGGVNLCAEEFSDHLADHILQQTIATTWTFVALKPE